MFCVFQMWVLWPLAGAADLKIDVGKLEWSEWTQIELLNKSFPKNAPSVQVVARCAWADYPGKTDDANAALVIQFKGVNLANDVFQVVGHYKLPPEIVPAFANIKMSHQRVFLLKGPKLGADVSTVKLPLKVNRRLPVDKIRIKGWVRSRDFINSQTRLESDVYNEELQQWSRKAIGNHRNN